MDDIFFEQSGDLKANPEIPDHFTLFALRQNFRIDAQVLEASFEDYIFRLHPDFFSQGSAEQKRLSLKFSAIIKQAKDELANPFTRAIYLCKLLGKNLQESDLQQPQDFLMEMLEVREKLETAEALTKETDLIKKLKEETCDLLEQIASDFDKLIGAENKEPFFSSLAQRIGKIKYYKNIEEQITSLK
jgi:molecular chaperone HscB